MNRFLKSIGSPLGLLGAFVLLFASPPPLLLASSDRHPTRSTQCRTCKPRQEHRGPPKPPKNVSAARKCRPKLTRGHRTVSLSFRATTYTVAIRRRPPSVRSTTSPSPARIASIISSKLDTHNYYYVVTSDRPGLRESASSNVATVPIPPQYPFSQTRSPNHTSGFLAQECSHYSSSHRLPTRRSVRNGTLSPSSSEGYGHSGENSFS